MKNRYFFSTGLILLCTILLTSSSQLSAQSFLWARQGSSQGFEYGNAIIADDSGNVYVSGQIEYSAVFGNITLTTNGKHDILMGKYDTNGNIKWVKHAGGVGGDVSWGVGIDAAHNNYHTGEFENTAGFNPGDSLTVQGSNDIFFAKYASDGSYIWAKRFGGTNDDKGKAIAVNQNGTCYLTGYFSGTGHFDGINLSSSSNSNDIYLVKTNSDGTVQWARKAGGTKEDRGRGVALDQLGNVYITGTITQSANFSGTNVSVQGLNSMFIAKYDTSGNFQWVRTAGGCCDTTRGNAITTDELGNAYVSGYFQDTANFGSTQLISEGSTDVFVVKYDPNGNVLWAKRAGGPYEDMSYACSYDAGKNLLYVTGQIDDHGYFGSIYVGARGNRDVFVAVYDTAGNVNWARPGGGTQRDAGQAITFDNLNNVYTTGFFNDTAYFGADTLRGYSLADFFVSKMSPALASQPSVNASSLQAITANCSDLQLNFTSGNGVGRIVIAKAGSAVSAFPVDGNYYTANSTFSSGANLGSGSYVVYNGSGNSVTVTGLTLGTRYYFQVVEYNGLGYAANYLNVGNPTTNAISNGFSLTASATSNAICTGASTQLNAHGAATYVWSPATGLSSTSDSVVTANPTTTTTYTVTGTSAASCTAQATVTISVNPAPVVTFGNLSPVCSSASPITLTQGSPAGGTYSGTGVSSGTFNPATAGAGQFILTYQYSNGGCSASDTSVIVVNAAPSVTLGTFGDICSAASAVTLTGGSPSGGIYSGTGVSNGSFNPAVAGVGTHTITYTVTGSNSCSASATSSINVLASPTVTFSNLSAVCGNTPSFALSGGSPAGGTYSGTGVSGGNFNPATSGAGQFIITYQYTNSGCSATDTSVITVNATPSVSFGVLGDVCSNASPVTLTGGSPSGGTYSGSGVSNGTLNPSVAGTGSHTITYSYTDANGCSNAASSSINILTSPTVTLGTFSPVCSNSAFFPLTGGSPSGGTYSGTGINNGNFFPVLAGVGNDTVRYTYSLGNGCSATAVSTILVNPLPVVSLSTFTPTCVNTTPFGLSGGLPVGGTYSGSGVSGTQFNPSVAGAGTIQISYAYTDANGCTNSAQSQIVVNAPPTVTLSAFAGACINGTPITLTGGSPSGGTYSGTGVSNGTFNPQIGTGTYTINYSVSQNGCLGSASRPITVFPAPSVTLGNDSVVCANSTVVLNVGSGFSTVQWSTGQLSNSIQVDSAGTGIGTKIISVVVTNSFGCQSSDTVRVTFDPCSGISQPVKENLGVFIYPNPFNGTFRVLVEKVVNISIYDMSGRLLEQHENVNGYIEAGSNLSAGTYFVDVIYQDQRKTLKVIKTEH